ncbi:MAG: hypothetical protein P1U65_17925 [Minwuia sp.]|nr:hypothetical protein [Minwuia sp.]
MMTRSDWHRRMAMAAPMLLVASAAHAEDPLTPWLTPWQIGGSLTTALEGYSDAGDPTVSPFAERTAFGFVEADLNLSRQVSPFERVQGQFFGVLVDNPFRSNLDGLVAERAHLQWEKGDGAVPFRFDAGDIFALTTARTSQRSLKGVHLELQPRIAILPGWQHSLVGFWGINQATYRQVDFDDDQTIGASWLMSRGRAGNISVNVVANRLGAGANNVAVERVQTVSSVAADRAFDFHGQALEWKGEVGFLFGDDLAGNDLDDTGAGLFTELRGRDQSMPLDYSIRLEQFDSDYSPNGAAVTAARRSLAANAGWRFDGGLSLRGRARWDRDGFGRANHTDTFSSGLNLAGPLDPGLGIPLNGTFDAFVTRTENETGTVKTTTQAASANLTAPLPGDLFGRFGYQFQATRALNATPTVSNTVTLGVDRRFSRGDLVGTLSPSLSVRRINGGNAEGEEVTLGLGGSLERGAVSARANYRLSKLFRDTAGADTVTNSLNGSLNWQEGRHSLALEADFNVTVREGSGESQPLKLAARYTFSFDKAAGQGLFDDQPPPQRFAAVQVPADAGVIDLAALAPNSALQDVLLNLADAGLRGGQAQQEGLIVYESPVLSDVALRQRLALLHQGARFRKSVLVINPSNPGDAAALQSDFQSVLAELIDAYGAPDATIDRGDFAGNVVQAIDDGDLIRIAEWRTASGTLRLGIPRRLDRQVRMEVHHARSFRAPTITLWGLESVI